MPQIWLALFFGYNGSAFCGMQHQKDIEIATIESVLVSRMQSAGLLKTDNYGELERHYKWSRAARTDKGVHAVVNSVSCLFFIDKKYFDEAKDLNVRKLEADLTDLFSDSGLIYHCFKRVTNRFEVRMQVATRSYCYLCPKWYFHKDRKRDIDATVLEKINLNGKQFIGTHNFHNYSKGLLALSPQAKRYVTAFSCEEFDQFYLFKITGQSFVYHQIRKMIGSIATSIVFDYPPEYISNTMFRNQVFVALAPPHGLYLSSLSFNSYNRKSNIPEQIDLTCSRESIQKLQKSIQAHIMSVDDAVWQEWHTFILESGDTINPENVKLPSQEIEEEVHDN